MGAWVQIIYIYIHTHMNVDTKKYMYMYIIRAYMSQSEISWLCTRLRRDSEQAFRVGQSQNRP